MKWLRLCFAVAMMALVSDAASAAGIDGDWDGTLHAGAVDLRLALHVETKDGTPTGSVTSIDQGGAVIAISALAVTGPSVSFSTTRPPATFDGTLSADGKTLAGNWNQGGAQLPLTFTRRASGASGPVMNRPQEPHPPYPYRSADVTYPGPGGITLAGTLTEPNGNGPFPTAILIAGSGPHDRDETIFGHKPFHVLADYLTRHGIAVLRSDKRGIGKSTGDYAAATSEDFAADADAAVAYLKTRSDIDAKKIGLIGHSEGGLIAPMVAAKDRSIAFIVLMAGPGLTGEQILVLQRRLIAQGMGETPEQTTKADAFQKALLDAIARGKTAEESQANAKAVIAAAQLTPAEQAPIDAQLPTLTSPWLRFFLTYDPAPTLGKVTCPILALDGGKDLQVPPKEDLAAIKAATSGNRDVTVVELPGLNHLFQTAQTGLPTEYGQIDETMAPAALDTIARWIASHTK